MYVNLYKENRRTFLKTFSFYMGTTALAATLPWLDAFAAGRVEDRLRTGQKVRLGIIGVGSRGSLLLIWLKQIPDVEIIAFCDNYPPHYEEAAVRTGPGAKGFYDYRKMLEMKDLDAVVIATPLHEHARMTIDALDAGLHVFCEKAMARKTGDVKRMLEAQRRTGRILQIGHQRLFNLKYLKAIDMIKSGRIGNVTQIRAYWHRNNDWRRPVPGPDLERKINWRLYLEYSCGLMTELASHQIQVANWILGEAPEKVSGFGSINYWHDGREVFDNVNLVYTYPSGVQLVYDSMTSNAHYGLEEQILAPEGTMELEGGKIFRENPPPAPGILQLINQIEHKVIDNIPVGGASWVPDNPNKEKGTYILSEDMESDGTDVQMEAFVQSVKEDKPTPGLVEEGYYASIAALLGHRSMMEEKVVSFPEELMI